MLNPNGIELTANSLDSILLNSHGTTPSSPHSESNGSLGFANLVAAVQQSAGYSDISESLTATQVSDQKLMTLEPIKGENHQQTTTVSEPHLLGSKLNSSIQAQVAKLGVGQSIPVLQSEMTQSNLQVLTDAGGDSQLSATKQNQNLSDMIAGMKQKPGSYADLFSSQQTVSANTATRYDRFQVTPEGVTNNNGSSIEFEQMPVKGQVLNNLTNNPVQLEGAATVAQLAANRQNISLRPDSLRGQPDLPAQGSMSHSAHSNRVEQVISSIPNEFANTNRALTQANINSNIGIELEAAFENQGYNVANEVSKRLQDSTNVSDKAELISRNNIAAEFADTSIDSTRQNLKLHSLLTDRFVPTNSIQAAVQLSANADVEPAHTALTQELSNTGSQRLNEMPVKTLSVHQNNWTNGLSSNISWMIRQDISRASINISPAELGPMNIQLSTQADQLNVTLLAQHTVTREILESSLVRLREQFENLGFTNVNVNVSDQEPRQQTEGETPGEREYTNESNSYKTRDTALLSENLTPPTVIASTNRLLDTFA